MNMSQMPKLAPHLPTHFRLLLLLGLLLYCAPLEQPERQTTQRPNSSGFSPTGLPVFFFHTLSLGLELAWLVCKVSHNVPLKTVTMIRKTLPRLRPL